MDRFISSKKQVKAFAPATCGNAAVGFDILGFAIGDVGDSVILTKREDKHIQVVSIDSIEELPFSENKNTAAVAVKKMCEELDFPFGFSIHIKKGIPLCSGMGGSAASAVAALVACNGFLVNPLSAERLADFALFGEKAASGDAHSDNIIPCLFGGLTLTQSVNPIKVIQLPVPELYCTLIYPYLKVSTREARQVLKKNIPMKDYIKQSSLLATFIAGLYKKNYRLLRESLQDTIIEPQRSDFVPGFYQIKEEAMNAGALGMSFSGSGPALFALSPTLATANKVRDAMCDTLHQLGIGFEEWVSSISQQPARVI